MMQKNKIIITCGRAISPFLKDEVLSLGLPVFSADELSVATEGDMEDAMRINLYSRTGHRVLYLISTVSAEGPEDLYRQINRLEWEKLLDADGYISVTSHVENRYISDSRYANLKCKDAIVDRMAEKFGRRPDSGPERHGAVVAIYWKESRCSVYLDTSGEPLSRRGYRKIPLKAPMQETLAAAVVLAAGWQGNGHFVNPMCGSGTLAIEAALLAAGRAPGSIRKNFGFMHVKGFDSVAWSRLCAGAKGAERKFEGRIIATDISAAAIDAAKTNAAAAGVKEFIEFGVCDYSETPVPEGGGTVVLNPPYGARMGEEDGLAAVYKGIGDFFKNKCAGYNGFIFTANPDLAKKVGLRPKRKIPFFNGGMECRLLQYELYQGTRKKSKLKGGADAQIT